MPFALDAVDAVLVSVLLVCAVTDLRLGRILNVVTYPAILFGLGKGLFGGIGGLAPAIAGCLLGGLPLYVFFTFGWMGGGDVKLMAAVGAIKGFPFILHAMFYSIFLGGTGAALFLIWQGHSGALLGDLALVVRRAIGMPTAPLQQIPARGGSFPFGVAICLGTLIALALEWSAA